MWDQQTTSALLEALKAINRTLDVRATLQAIADQAARVMRAEASSVLLLDSRKKALRFLAACGCKGDQLIGDEFDASLGIAGQVLESGRSRQVNDVSDDPSFFQGIDSKLNFRTRNLICSPMIYQGEPIGVIEVLNRRDGAFGDGDLELLEVFANLAAIGTVNAQKFEGLKRENQTLQESVFTDRQIIGADGSLRGVMELLGKVAHTNATVLLLGETGTGKELIAKTIHRSSERAEHPFVAVNCAALPEGLLESELFGHEKGSFTGAVAQKPGRFELADGGTIFLDEVGELSTAIQVKLLRVLQEREFTRVGGTKTIATDVRIIAATNRDLKQAMQEGKFRDDLYYRLNVFPIHLPPLRRRRDDIPELIRHTVARASDDLKVPKPAVSPATEDLLVNYQWPGNIRELQNVIERAVLLASGRQITPADLPREITGDPEPLEISGDAGDGLAGQERRLILRALEGHNWNQTKAADALGITRDVLRYRMKKHNLGKPDPNSGAGG